MGLSDFVFSDEKNTHKDNRISRAQLDEQFKELAEIEGISEEELTLRAKAYYLMVRHYEDKSCRIITIGGGIYRSLGTDMIEFE